jgi:D-3-phosphoglycerate dehydrogenase
MRWMRKDSILINTSRSEVIDYEYLYYMLKKKIIKGAALDVFKKEPYKGKFSKLTNVLLTPHIGSYAQEIRDKMELDAVESIIKF